MSRVKPFIIQVNVNRDYLRDDPETVRAHARDVLMDKADNLTGPRGGRYIAVNEPYDFREGESGDDFMRNEVSFTARVTGRYVRPKR